MPSFFMGVCFMDWALVTGSAALIGVLWNFIRIGEWKAKTEAKVEGLEKSQVLFNSKIDELAKSINRQNELFARLTTKIDIYMEKRKDGGKQ